MDALIEAINLEIDRTKRKAMLDRLQEIYAEEVPVIGLYWRSNPHILPKWLKGLRPTGQMAPSTLWVEDWTVEGRRVRSYLVRPLAESPLVLAITIGRASFRGRVCQYV